MSETPDPCVLKARETAGRSVMPLRDMGAAMRYAERTAKQAAWNIVDETGDPRVKTLRRFADAVGVPLRDLF